MTSAMMGRGIAMAWWVKPEFSVADSFDVMTGDRPYQGAQAREEAVSEIGKEVGVEFDPTVVADIVRRLGKGPSEST